MSWWKKENQTPQVQNSQMWHSLQWSLLLQQWRSHRRKFRYLSYQVAEKENNKYSLWEISTFHYFPKKIIIIILILVLITEDIYNARFKLYKKMLFPQKETKASARTSAFVLLQTSERSIKFLIWDIYQEHMKGKRNSMILMWKMREKIEIPGGDWYGHECYPTKW